MVSVGADFWWSPRGALFSFASSCSLSTDSFVIFVFLRCEHVDESSKRPSAGGVAMRRRQRRLRSCWRHEQRSVAAALAAATHHSAPRSGWPEQHNAPRGPTTASAMEEEVREVNDALEGQKRPPPGTRPAPLSEVAGPQAAVTVGYVAAGGASLGCDGQSLCRGHRRKHPLIPPC